MIRFFRTASVVVKHTMNENIWAKVINTNATIKHRPLAERAPHLWDIAKQYDEELKNTPPSDFQKFNSP